MLKKIWRCTPKNHWKWTHKENKETKLSTKLKYFNTYTPNPRPQYIVLSNHFCLLLLYLVGLYQKKSTGKKVYIFVFLARQASSILCMAHYAGQLLAPAENFGQDQGFFCSSGRKRLFWIFLAHFRPFLVFSSDLNNC